MTSLKVNADNFVRAETHRMMSALQGVAGGVNRFAHDRAPASVDRQTVIRLNRDTLYSFAVVDLSRGAAVTLPDAGGRYLSVMVVDENHDVTDVLHDAGSHDLRAADVAGPYVVIAARTLVDPRDPADLAAVAAVQDGLAITAAADRPFVMPDYDTGSLDRTRAALLALAAEQPSFSRTFGRREDVDPVRHLIGTAAGWGGLPDTEAVYVGVTPRLPVGEYTLNVGDVPVDGFWSISVYNAEGYFEPNADGAYSVNSITATRDDDGGVTVRFGGSGENCLPIVEGWNYLVRLYRPRAEVLDGTWTFPSLTGSSQPSVR